MEFSRFTISIHAYIYIINYKKNINRTECFNFFFPVGGAIHIEGKPQHVVYTAVSGFVKFPVNPSTLFIPQYQGL